MKTICIAFLCFIIPSISFGQIEVLITKISTDSVSIKFPADMVIEAGKTYKFRFKTDITLADSVMESFTYEYLYDGLVVSEKFDHYERGFNLISKRTGERNSMELGRTMFYIKGTSKWIVSIDGKNISRYNSNDIFPSSTIDVEVQSDKEDLAKAKYEGSVVVYWVKNQGYYQQFKFDGNKLHIDLKDYPDFFKGIRKDVKWNPIAVLLPQVIVKGKELFSAKEENRMYMMRFLNQ